MLEGGGDEDQAIAALLHDAAEDQGGEPRIADIRVRFGERVARIVHGCSDSFVEPKPDWRPRKEAYIARLADEEDDVRLVSVADKLHNSRSILMDFRLHGDALFSRFTGRKEGTLWYYQSLVTAYRGAGFSNPLVDELERTVAELLSVTATGAAPRSGIHAE